MAQLAIPLAGAVVGGFLGGGTGAQIGWMIGSLAQGSDSTSSVAGSSIGDVTVSTSAYGTNLQKVIGVDRVFNPQVWWSTEKVPHTKKTKTSGKGSSSATVESTSYTVTMMIAICEGPIKGVIQVYDNDKLVVDCSDGVARALPGTLYLGTNTQGPDPIIQSHFPGVQVPAFHGIAYMVLHDFPLGASGTLPNFSFVVDGA